MPGGAQGGRSGGTQGGPPGGDRASFDYPVILLLVSENARFGAGTDELKYEWGAVDAGLVAQNLMLFCAGNGLVAHPKAAEDREGTMKNLLNLTDTQHTLLLLDVGYPKE
jgi:nitroreductase